MTMTEPHSPRIAPLDEPARERVAAVTTFDADAVHAMPLTIASELVLHALWHPGDPDSTTDLLIAGELFAQVPQGSNIIDLFGAPAEADQ